MLDAPPTHTVQSRCLPANWKPAPLARHAVKFCLGKNPWASFPDRMTRQLCRTGELRQGDRAYILSPDHVVYAVDTEHQRLLWATELPYHMQAGFKGRVEIEVSGDEVCVKTWCVSMRLSRDTGKLLSVKVPWRMPQTEGCEYSLATGHLRRQETKRVSKSTTTGFCGFALGLSEFRDIGDVIRRCRPLIVRFEPRWR